VVDSIPSCIKIKIEMFIAQEIGLTLKLSV
jgi:hypothetical protein